MEKRMKRKRRRETFLLDQLSPTEISLAAILHAVVYFHRKTDPRTLIP